MFRRRGGGARRAHALRLRDVMELHLLRSHRCLSQRGTSWALWSGKDVPRNLIAHPSILHARAMNHASRKLALRRKNAILSLSRHMPRIGRPFNQSFRNKVFEYMEKFKKSEDAEFSRNDVRRAAKLAISEEPFVHDVYLRQLKFSTGWCRLILSHINKKQSSAALKSRRNHNSITVAVR
jgi:hypothetical protein